MTIVAVSQILLWVAVAVLGVLVAALARQVGVLHERIAPAGALTLHQKLAPGDVAPEMVLQTIDDAEITIGGRRERSQLLFFTAPDCPICKSLLPVLKSAAAAERSWVDVILASDGPAPPHRRLAIAEGLLDIPYVLSEQLGRQLGVSKLPYAVLIAEDGRIASLGLVNTREHLESLFEAKERGLASLQDFLAQRKEVNHGQSR